MRKKKIKRVSKFSKLISSLLFIMLLSLPIISIGTKAFVSKLNFEVESLKTKIKKQDKTNQSISMKINELSSLENIQSVAKEYGLSYNNENIKVVLK